MKVATKTLLMITAITLILALPAMAASSPAPAKSRVHAKVAPAPAPAEEHPQIRAVWRPYATRKNTLNTLPTIFGGHRVEAIHAIDEAIRQPEICLKYDKDES